MSDLHALFGEALLDRFHGEQHPFFLEIGDQRYKHDLGRYFRSEEALSKSEKRLISMCCGHILDVGCGTGNYMPAMEKMGQVIGIDISPKVIEVARLMGRTNCFVQDILLFDSDRPFDTITMLENNIGMGETIDGTKNLLSKMHTLLKPDGKILILLGKRAKNSDYLLTEITLIYKNLC